MVRVLASALPALPVLLIAAGCVTTYGDQRTRQEMQAREDLLLIQEDNQRLKGRIEGLELEMDRLRRSVDAMRTDQPRATQAQIQALEGSIADLDRRIKALDAAREKDKQAIIDSLSAKIAQIVSASTPAPTKVSPSTKRAPSGQGYEHEVRAGESLSAIAAAYGVKSSEIIQANNLKDPNQLRVGQKLFIPAP